MMVVIECVGITRMGAQFMANLSWQETPLVSTAYLDDVPVCALKTKDIGGCIASWLDGRLWPAPAHLPKASPQPTRFFANVADARAAVEQLLTR
jgi:hypothetical protein